MNQSADFEERKSPVEKIYSQSIHIVNFIFSNIRRHFLVFLLCLAVPTLVLVGRSLSRPTLYEASFTVMYEELVRKIYGDRLEKVNTLVTQKSPDKVARLLGIKESSAAAIYAIIGTNILGQELSEDLNTDKIPFVVTLQVTDSSVLHEVEMGLVNFLGTGTPYLANKKAIKLDEINKELEYVNRQISQLDSIQSRMGSRSSANVLVAAPEADGKSIYEFSYELYKKKQELERKRQMPDNLQVIDDIIVPVKVKPAYLKLVAIGIAVGLVLYALLMLFVLPVLRYKTPARHS